MTSTTTPNMFLIEPVVGQEFGPQYAFDINNSLTLIDQHNHSAGQGVQINPNGININTSLPFNNNFITSLAGLTLIAQSSTPADLTVYVSGNDLYYVDALGNNIQITKNGSVAGATGSITGLTSPASASYVSGSSTFVWQSNTSIAANMDFGAAIMRNISPNSTNALTLQPPASLSSNYSITLPTLPSSQKIMTLDNSGNMAAPYTVDGSTIVINSSVIEVPTGGITDAQIATATITSDKFAPGAAFGSTVQVVFNTPGATTWTVPAGVVQVTVQAVGGGGGGAGALGATYGSSGGMGCMLQQYIIPVTPSTVIPIVIGAGGVGGARSFNGGAGGDTLFNGVTLCFGGPGGVGGASAYPSATNINLWWDGSPTHTAGGLGGNGSTNGFNGGSSGSYLGGAGGAANNYGGGGGASSYGPGGAGGTTGASALSTSYGAAGGGNYPASLLQAGNGAGGQLVIYY
jgi:hypothetical protein